MKVKFLIFPLVLALFLSACGPAASETTALETQAAETQAAETLPASLTFTDDLGRSVTVEDPQRVAVLLGSFAQIWQLSGGQVIAAPDDAWEDLALELPEDAVNLGSLKNLSLELLLSSQPDFIIASSRTRQHLQWQEPLEKTGIPLAYFDVADFPDYLRMLEICTGITGRQDLYQENGLAVQQQIQQVIESSQARLAGKEPPKVLLLSAAASFLKARNSQGNVMGPMLKNLGCENIADSDTMLLEELSMEHILLADPDYLFIVPRGDNLEGAKALIEQTLTSHPAWNKLSAVQKNQVFYMDKTLYNLKPNNRWGEAYEKLEAILAAQP